jgi:hypothetical protein
VTRPPDFTPATVFALTRPLAELPDTLRLGALEWSLLLATTGRHGVGQIGALFAVAPAARDAAFATLRDLGLIVERELTRLEFLTARDAVPAGEPLTLAAFLTGEPDFVPLDPTSPEETMAPVVPLLPRRRLSLKALMAFLAEGAASAEEGQMNVYRLFIRLDPQRLQKNGIKTLRFEDDRLVEDPELQEEILAAVEATFGRSCPPSVFV